MTKFSYPTHISFLGTFLEKIVTVNYMWINFGQKNFWGNDSVDKSEEDVPKPLIYEHTQNLPISAEEESQKEGRK
jgi:hypothetical protein